MQKIGNESTAPASGADRESGNGWLKGHWCALSLGIIVIVAFLLRFVFAYGVSADGGYALSGGSSAQYHLHVIESILNGSWALTDSAVNYPVGGSLYIPPLMDFLGAGVASIFQGSMGTTAAASLSLAVLNPLFGALACIPVYLIGKEMFDKTIGVLAALVFAFLALPISTSVFSSGNEYALAAFLLAFMAYFAVKMVKAADAEDSSKKGILINGALTGIFLALAALTWNGFRVAVVLLAVAMILQVVSSRVRGKDFKGITAGYAIAILVGTLIPAAYYVPAGLMDSVYSGSLIIAIVSVVFAYVFLGLREKPWIVTIPALVVAFIVICVALAFLAPQIFNDFIFGNSVYSSSIMEQLASNRVSLSNVAAYYGWLTMWMPLALGLYEAYVYLRHDRSCTQLFMVIWMLVMFFAAWSNYATAAVIGSVFAVATAAAIVKAFKAFDVKGWYADMKVAGFPGCFRKMIKPAPFVTVLMVAFLVIVPNFSFAVDAGQPTNTEGDHFYTGNTSFTIKTGDSYPVGDIWESYSDTPKDGALVTWIDYAYDAVSQGGFTSVTDSIGGGASAAAQMYLAEGSSGAVSAMMLRIMMSNTSLDYSKCFNDSAVYQDVKAYINDPAKAIAEINANPETYGEVRSDITDENAVYLVGINKILTSMSPVDIMDTYDRVCDVSNEKIGYILFDGSMLPLQYGDSSNFSTIAYFADYSVDGYGAASEFFSYNTYYGTTQYTSAIYDTLVWKALIGPSASEAGYSSSYSYLTALAVSDGKEGSAMATPGYGLAGFKVTSWKVMYNEDDKATVSSDGWKYMDGYEAIEKQKTDGGVINYLYGIVMLEYTGASSGSNVLSGQVASASGEKITGANVCVYQYDAVYGKQTLYSEARTNSNGQYSVQIPSGDYRVDVKIGDLVLNSFTNGGSADVTVQTSTVNGEVRVNDTIYAGESMALVLKSDATKVEVDVVDGEVKIDNILPGTYSYALYDDAGSSMGTGNVTIYPGNSEGFIITPTTYTITATVNDIYGNAIDGTAYSNAPIVFVTNTETGETFSKEVGEDGKAVISVIPGKYTSSLGNGLVTISSTTSNATSGNRTVTLTAYESTTVSVSGAGDIALTISAGEFSTTSNVINGSLTFDAPVGIATDDVCYSVYGVNGSSVVYGVYTGGNSISLQSATGVKYTGQLKDGDSNISGTVTLYNSNGFQISASTDKDGKFTILAPSGEYTVYAHNGNNKVYFGTVNASNAELGDVKVVDGRKVTATLKYDTATSSGNKNLPYVLGFLKFNYESKDYTLVSMTNTSGSVTFYMPDNVEANVYYNDVNGTLDNGAFSCTKLTENISSGTSNSSKTTTIHYIEEGKTQDNVVKEQSVTSNYTMTLVYYEDDDDKKIEVVAGVAQNLRPGQYEVDIDGATGYYFSGTIYLYPGQTQFTGLDEVVEVTTVKIVKDEADSVKIESDGEYYSFTGGYYFEKGHSYSLTSTKKVDGKEKICYGYVDIDSSNTSYVIDMTASADKMQVTGYVGVAYDGTITISYNGIIKEFDIDAGAYTLVLPSDVGTIEAYAEVSTTIDSKKVVYSATEEFSGMTDGSIRNIPVISSEPQVEDPTFTVTIDSVNFSNGIASVGFTIMNYGNDATTYLVSSGNAWSLDTSVSVTVAAGSTGKGTATGYYDEKNVAPGHDGVTLIVKDINGKATVTEEITGSASSGSVTVLTSGEKGASADKVSASQYMYALTLVNDEANAKSVSISLTVPAGWYATIMDSDGTRVMAVGSSVFVPGLSTTTYYVALMQEVVETNSTAQVPAIKVTVGSESLDLNPTGVEVSTEGSDVSGGDAIKERSGIPGGIWFLVAVMILMIIAILWLASKRGVFGR